MRELIIAELNKDITQRDLAGKIGFSHSTIQKILFTETKHTYDIRKKVADYFHVPVSDFYDATLSIGQRTDIVLRDVAGGINERYSPYNKVDKYKVIAEVGEILDSGNADIITALVKNVQEFKRAVDTSKRLNVCEEELKLQRKEIDTLREQVARLTAPPITAKRSEDSSVNEKT